MLLWELPHTNTSFRMYCTVHVQVQVHVQTQEPSEFFYGWKRNQTSFFTIYGGNIGYSFLEGAAEFAKWAPPETRGHGGPFQSALWSSGTKARQDP